MGRCVPRYEGVPRSCARHGMPSSIDKVKKETTKKYPNHSAFLVFFAQLHGQVNTTSTRLKNNVSVRIGTRTDKVGQTMQDKVNVVHEILAKDAAK